MLTNASEATLPSAPETWIAAVKEFLGDSAHCDLSEKARDGLTALEWADRAGIPLDVQAKASARTLGVHYVEDLADRKPSAQFVERFPISFARKHSIMAFASESDAVVVALADVRKWGMLDTVSRCLRCRVELLFAPAEHILAAINSAYQQRTGQAQTLLDSLDRQSVLAEIANLNGREDLLDVSGRAPVVKLVNLMLFEAVKGLASDVHIQPYEDRLVVRLRIDGVLFDAFNVPKAMQEEVVSRIKVVGGMNIAEKRLPQDGRATVQVGNRLIDLRIASLPSIYGERVVIRLLDKSARLYTLPELGMDEQTLDRFRELIRLEHGLILVTGPTGSGKSTTLYAALQEISAKDRNVITLEDPIEYQIQRGPGGQASFFVFARNSQPKVGACRSRQ